MSTEPDTLPAPDFAKGHIVEPGSLTERELLELVADQLAEIMALIEQARPALEAFAAFDPASAPGWLRMLIPGAGK